ncbi:MAG: hypothetical protein ETSY1_44545 [Candidatus Entotheonella factor]|uniref:Uncharacterized protein n=1 Tax=Entotheonella factor TaxID=1429438 RepID=W4L3I7_ENTF1|nr:MAG: hypothetical protein ETSY1_44545 [Candidatus Entotheonella factor]
MTEVARAMGIGDEPTNLKVDGSEVTDVVVRES